MRSALRLVALGLLCACADNIVGPNTDVGLSVWAEVAPSSLSVSDTAGALRIRVFVGNRTIREIRVISGGPPYVFTDDPAMSKGLWGSIRIANDSDPLHAGPSMDLWGDSLYVFPPLYRVYDEEILTLKEWKTRGWPLTPGRYRVRSWFNAREGKSADFTLTP
jgi:hypothetical protein